MKLTYNIKNKILPVGGLIFSVVATIMLAQSVFADSSGFLFPASDGSYIQWTTNTGTTHFTLVDEAACNGTTDYNFTNTLGNRDSYNVTTSGTIPNGATITAVKITPCASRNANGSGSSTMNVFYRYNGTNSADAGNYALIGTTLTQLTSTTFSGLSLVKSSTSTLQVGAVFSTGNKGARLSRIVTEVIYTPLAAPSNLTANVTGTTSTILNWTDNATTETGFKVERHNTATTTFSEIASVGANIKTYTDPGLAPGTYTYRVRAFNSGGFSTYSNSATTTIL